MTRSIGSARASLHVRRRASLLHVAAIGTVALLLLSTSYRTHAQTQAGAALFAAQCAGCHNDVQHPKGLVYNAAGNVAIIEAVNAFGMGAKGSLPEHTTIAEYLDAVKPTISLAAVARDSPGTAIDLADIIVSGAELHASWKIIDDIQTVSAPTKGTVTYHFQIGFGEPSFVVYTPLPGQSGVDTWTYRGTGPGGTTTVRTASVKIAAAPGSTPSVLAVEYYHAGFGHYFITANPDEISKLDTGVFPGWVRTGQTFNVYNAQIAGSVPVCRFFTTAFPPTSSHFYAPRGLGCEGTLSNKDWQFEGDVFYAPLPDANGACPTGTSAVYRLYNNGQGGAPNHRFTTSLAIRAQMLAAGYVAEGSGIGIGMCSPD